MNRREFFRSTVGVSAAAIVLPNLPERKSVRQGVLLEHCIAPGQATALQLLDHEGRGIPCMRREQLSRPDPLGAGSFVVPRGDRVAVLLSTRYCL